MTFVSLGAMSTHVRPAFLSRGRRRPVGRYVVGVGAFLLLWLALRTCSRPKGPVWTEEGSLTRVDPPPLSDDRDPGSLTTAVGHSLRYYDKLPAGSSKRFGRDVVTVDEIRDTLVDFRGAVERFGTGPALAAYAADNYVFYKTAAASTLVTGYYESRLRGARKASGPFRYPLYRTPPDLSVSPDGTRVRLGPDGRPAGPYHTREDIDVRGALDGRGLELLFVADPVERFFLHIQGSGMVTLPDGTVTRVGYAEKNGRPYKPIGAYMVAQGYLRREEVTMRRIRDFLAARPDLRDEIFASDPSYVFFRENQEGPLGNLGVPVTPYRSIATDVKLFPKGAPGVLVAARPVLSPGGEVERWEPFTRFILNQDTGGAIRGADHVDLFTGAGDEAEAVAGAMKYQGDFFFFRLRRPGE